MVPDVIRGHFRRKVKSTTGCRLFTIGDSINNIYTSNRVLTTLVGRAVATSIPWLGAMTGTVNCGNTGWNLSCHGFTPLDLATTWSPLTLGSGLTERLGPSSTGLRPGDAFPVDSSTGHNVLRVVAAELTGNCTDFSVALVMQLYNHAWIKNKTVTVGALCRTTTTSPNQWSLAGRTLANGAGQSVALALRTANSYTAYRSASYDISSHVSDSFSDVARITTFNETEGSGGTRTDMQVLALDLAQASVTTGGIYWGYAGEGGYTTLSHLAAGESLNPGGFGAYTAYYSDAALTAHLAFGSFNTIRIWLGANRASNEGSGNGIGSFKENLLSIISRYRACCASAGLRDVTFILCSQYDLSDTNGQTRAQAQAAREIALANPDVEFVDSRNIVEARWGSWSSWQATGTTDGVHPASSLSTLVANNELEKLQMTPSRPTSSPAPSGGAALRKLAWLGKARVYRSAA